MNSKDLTVAAPSSATTNSATERYTIMRGSTVTPDQIGPEHLNQLHLVWGTLATAQHLGDSGAFLRTQDDQEEPTLRLRLTKALADTVWEHMGWTAAIPAVAGVTFLAGSVPHSGSGGVPFMRLDSTTQLALTPGR